MNRPSLTVLLLLVACGDDASSAAPDAGCPPLPDAAPLPDAVPPDPGCIGDTTCGGDLTGDWDMTASCAVGSGDAAFFNCPEGEVHDLSFMARGHWTFGADGSVTAVVDEHAEGRMELPLTCFTFDTCAQVEAVAEAAGDAVELDCRALGPQDEFCAVIDESCDCGVVVSGTGITLTATITTDPAAGTFSLTMGNETVTGEYCVAGDQLFVHFIRFGGVDYRYRFQRAAP
jgi:hypothetical protein